jgi:hypothetical protein
MNLMIRSNISEQLVLLLQSNQKCIDRWVVSNSVTREQRINPSCLWNPQIFRLFDRHSSFIWILLMIIQRTMW